MPRILIVEDSRTQRHMMANLLRSHAFEVATASDGLDALERLERIAPDLIILDVVMPGLNGFELCRRLKARPSTQRVPVLLCSANATDVDRYWGLKQGAIAYLSKPFQPQELIDTVNQIVKQPNLPLSGSC